MGDYDDNPDEVSDDDILELEEMVIEGQVWACCPKCRFFVVSVFDEKCSNCKYTIDINSLIIKFIDWEKSN